MDDITAKLGHLFHSGRPPRSALFWNPAYHRAGHVENQGDAEAWLTLILGVGFIDQLSAATAEV